MIHRLMLWLQDLGTISELSQQSRTYHTFHPQVRFIADPDLAYVACRAREVHDFWHVLFDCDTNVPGEVALKALEFVQVGAEGELGADCLVYL